MFKDCQGLPYPVFAKGVVSECTPLVGAVPFGSVYSLKVLLEAGSQEPAAGQFYMLHALRSDVLLGRPVSVFHSEVLSEEEGRRVELTFLILLKGKGTKELCSLDFGDLINLIGPCGNRFPSPVVECAQSACIETTRGRKSISTWANEINQVAKIKRAEFFCALPFQQNQKCEFYTTALFFAQNF